VRIELPLLVARRGPRLWEAWVAMLPFRESGPSLAALRDDLALAVMERFERTPVDELGAYQRAPHQRLVHVQIDTIARDQRRGIKRPLAGRMGVLLEKFPCDDFWIATPTRLPEARFVVERPDQLAAALERRLAAWSLKHDLESLAPFAARPEEHLEILDVDVYPPSLLPRGPQVVGTAATRPRASAPETALEIEEQRRRNRLNAKTLRAVARNLSHAADDEGLDRALAREGLVASLADELTSREGMALVLVGPSGVGKTAVIHELTRRLLERSRATGRRRDVWRLDGGRFIAGQKYVGQWEARAHSLCQELAETADILYADDLASLVWAGRTSDSDNNLARFIEPHLSRGEITVIAECTPDRLDAVREEAPGFAALFRVIEVPPLSERDTLHVLLGVLRSLEEDESALPPRLSPAALELVVAGVRRFRPSVPLPGPAVRLLRRVLAGAGRAQATARWFETGDVLEALRAETGLPPFIVGSEPPRAKQSVRAELEVMVAGQPEALDAVTDVVMALQAGLGDPEKPLANLMFVGPTGVGKTETAKALARYLFGGEDRLVRFDMSELSSPASVGRLVGQAGGLDGELAVALRSQPFRVILFDEVEKAHPRVFDALLQLLGEGRLTDPSGRTADARQSVVIMTSNLGVREALHRPGFLGAPDDGRQHYLTAVQGFFRPEFFNRIDRVVPFRALDRAALRLVVEHALQQLLSRRGIQRGNVVVDVEPVLLDLLVEQAYDPRFGARPLRRALERELTVPLAHHLVARRAEELALVDVFRQGDSLGLAVRLLVDAPAAPEANEFPAGLEQLHAELARLRTQAVALRSSPHVGALARREGPEDARESLLFDVDELVSDLERMEGAATSETYEEVPDVIRVTKLRRGYEDPRERPGFLEVPFQKRRRALEREVAPQVSTLRDRLILLEHQLASPPEPCTLLIACVGLFDAEALEAVAQAALPVLLRGTRLEERVSQDAVAQWIEAGDRSMRGSLRRLAFCYQGPGSRGVLQPLAGWALVRVVSEAREVTVPVRLELLGGMGPEAIAAHDGRVAADREARARRVTVEAPPPGVVTLRRASPRDPLVAVATGRPVHPPEAFAAALLRARSTV
jgi:ATP-dependent Clp protease ATP-binding subunit ClpC